MFIIEKLSCLRYVNVAKIPVILFLSLSFASLLFFGYAKLVHSISGFTSTTATYNDNSDLFGSSESTNYPIFHQNQITYNLNPANSNKSECVSSSMTYFFYGIAIAAFLLPKISVRKELPILMLVSKWLRWLLFAAVFSFLVKFFEISSRADWVHFITGLMLWFLCETGYNWIAIKILSRSDIPLFPGFKIDEDEDENTESENLIKNKEWLCKKGFKCLSSLKAQLFEDVFISVSLYENSDHTTRIQISSIPRLGGTATRFYTIITNGKNDTRLVTDNHSLPFGGFYPRKWYLLRKPLVGSLNRLLALHKRRLKNKKFEVVPYENKPLEELNKQQKVLEELNIESGFLNPGQQHEEDGKLSYDGRYRLWKEMWLLAYLGKPICYNTLNCRRPALGQSI